MNVPARAKMISGAGHDVVSVDVKMRTATALQILVVAMPQSQQGRMRQGFQSSDERHSLE